MGALIYQQDERDIAALKRLRPMDSKDRVRSHQDGKSRLCPRNTSALPALYNLVTFSTRVI
jgi:hypothetical protein